MDFALGEEVQAFRTEVQTFFAELLLDEHRQDLHVAGSPNNVRFRKAVAEKGWLSAGWPPEYGGQGRDNLQLDVLADEAVFADAPLESFSGSLFVANALLSRGTEQQKREILAKVLAGDVRICLGYSEPDAGSDVASVRTKAERDGDDWIINGQKMFTSHAEDSQYVFLLTRTNADVPKHKGLTMFLVPLDSPGVEIRSLAALAGGGGPGRGRGTTTTYYTDVRVPDWLRVGDIDAGWSVLNVALNFEHGGGSNSGRSLSAMGVRLLNSAVECVRERRTIGGGRLIDDPSVRERLARIVVENEVSRLLAYRAAWNSTQGKEGVSDGPVAKVFSRESFQRSALDLMDMLGTESLLDAGEDESPHNGWIQWAMLHSVVKTITGGTSEIQRNIIAERGLGLPRMRKS